MVLIANYKCVGNLVNSGRKSVVFRDFLQWGALDVRVFVLWEGEL